MREKIMGRIVNVICLMTAFALLALPVSTKADPVTTGTPGEGESNPEEYVDPFSPMGDAFLDTMTADEGVTLNAPELVGITIEREDATPEDEKKKDEDATWVLKAKITGVPETMQNAEIIIGEKEDDGETYVKTEIYPDTKDAVNGAVKIAEKVEDSNGWKPDEGSELVVAISGEVKAYDASGSWKYKRTGYTKTYKVKAGKKRREKMSASKKIRLKVYFRNKKNKRKIWNTRNYYFEEGETYEIPALNINGYTAEQAKLTGTMGSEDTVVEMDYTGKSVPVKVSYVNYSSEEVAQAYEKELTVGDTFSVDSPEVEGYVLSNDYDKTVKGTVPPDGVQEKVWYSEERYGLEVNYLNEEGAELDSDSAQLKPGDTYSYEIPKFDGYSYKPVEGDQVKEVQKKNDSGEPVTDDEGNPVMVKAVTGTMGKEKKEITVNYIHNTEAVKISFTHKGTKDSTPAPTGMPTEPVVLTDKSRTDIKYAPPVIEGWTLVGSAGYATSWYDARKNLITVPGVSWEMYGSSPEKPYELAYTYTEEVDATLTYKWDDGTKTGAPAASQTVTVLAGSEKSVDLPIVEAAAEEITAGTADGYVCSRGTLTTINANDWVQDTDGAVYYSPYTWEDGRKVVEGTPAAVSFDSNWDAKNPDAPYTIDVDAAWTAGMDKDNLCKYNENGSSSIEVYVGGDAKTGTLVSESSVSSFDTKAQASFTIDTGSRYFRDHHDAYSFTVYEERRLTGETVYVKTTFTEKLPLTPVESLASTDNNLYRAVDISDATVTLTGGSTHVWNSGGAGSPYGYKYAFPVTAAQDTEYSGVELAWSMTNEQLDAMGVNNYTSGTLNNVILKATYNDKTVDLGGSALFAKTDTGRTVTCSAYLPADAIGSIALDAWVEIEKGWAHATATTTVSDWPGIAAADVTVNDTIEATSVTAKGFNDGNNQVDGVTGPGDVYEIIWSDSNNTYCKYINGDPDGKPKEYHHAGYAYNIVNAANGSQAAISCPGYNGSTVYAGTTPVGVITKLETLQSPENDPSSGDLTATYKATVKINKARCVGNLGKDISFTLWNQGIGIEDTSNTSGYTTYKITTDSEQNYNTAFYYYDSGNAYYGEGDGEVTYTEVVKPMKTPITATLPDGALAGGYTDSKVTIDTAKSTLSQKGALSLSWTVDDTLKAALAKDADNMSYAVFAVNCDEETDQDPINPVLKTNVAGQSYYCYGYSEYGTNSVYGATKPTLNGNTLTWDVSLVTKDSSSDNTMDYIAGGKYKIGLLMKGFCVDSEADPATGSFYTATAYAVLPAGQKPAVVTIDDLDITKATVARTYEDADGNKYPELNLEWTTSFTGIAEADAEGKLGFGAGYIDGAGYYGTDTREEYKAKDVQVSVEVYDVDFHDNPDYYRNADDTTQRSHTLSLSGGSYRCYLFGNGSMGKPRERMSRAYQVTLKYKYKTYNKYGGVDWKIKKLVKDIKVTAGTIPVSDKATDEQVLFQVDNAGNGLVRISGDRKLVGSDIYTENNSTATILFDGKQYGEAVALQAEDTSNKNWYAWVDLGDGYGKAIDTSKLSVTLSGKDYDANTFDPAKTYPAVAEDFVKVSYAREKKGSFGVVYAMAIPNESFRPSTTYWSVSGKSDVQADNGAVVESEWQKIPIYSGDVVFSDTGTYPDSETGLFFGKFKSLAGKIVRVKTCDHNGNVRFTSSAIIKGEDDTDTAITITEASYDINGNVKLAGTYDSSVVDVRSWNTVTFNTEGPDGVRYGDSIGSDVVFDKDKGTFSFEGSLFTPSGNSIFGYTLRQFAGLPENKDLVAALTINGIRSDMTGFIYKGGSLVVTDSMISSEKDGESKYLKVTLPRGYYANATDIGKVIGMAASDSAGLKFVSAEDDVEIEFDTATVKSMAEDEQQALLSVTKYSGQMPEHVTKSGLTPVAAYEIGVSRTFTGTAKVRLASDAELRAEGTPTVFYVSTEGKTEKMPTTYSMNQYGEVVSEFDTSHCSTWVVIYEGQAVEPQPTPTDVPTPTPTDNPQPTQAPADPTQVPADPAQPTQAPTDNLQPTQAPSASQTVQDAAAGNTYVIITGQDGTAEASFKALADANAKTVEIPATVNIGGVEYKVTYVEKDAFKNNKAITEVKIGSNVEVIEESAFEGCTSLKKVTIPDSVEEIGDKAFSGCKSLTSINTGKNTTKIGDSAFAGCTSLKSATIGSKITEIGDGAFAKCTSLKKLTIPKKVNKLGKKIFSGDKKITIVIKTTRLTAKNVSNKAFTGLGTKAVIKVPKKKKAAYQTLFRKKGLSKKVKIK